jgi:hypothetical protein
MKHAVRPNETRISPALGRFLPTSAMICTRGNIFMNTIRMAAFAAAVLITAFLFRAMADGFTYPQPIDDATLVHGAAAAHSQKTAAD